MAPAPALSRLLSRAARQPCPAATAEHAALSLFGVDADETRLPVAPFRYFGEFGEAPSGYCLNADPVHLRADTHGLILFDASTLGVSDAESEALSLALAEYFAGHGWSLQAGSAQRWYLTGRDAGDLLTTPLAQVSGKTVERYLPRGPGAARWLQRGNEIQMLLHTHPVNQQRVARGAPAINSLWLWGGGVLPQRDVSHFTRVYGDDPLIAGLSRWQGARHAPLPADLQTALDDAQPADALLVVLDGCLRPGIYSDFEAWNATIERYERDWFAPALRALSQRRIGNLQLLPVDGGRYALTGRDLWRVWRSVRPYRAIVQGGGAP